MCFFGDPQGQNLANLLKQRITEQKPGKIGEEAPELNLRKAGRGGVFF